MLNTLRTILTLILIVGFLSSCGEHEYCTEQEVIDIFGLEQAAEQDRLEEVWGKPVETVGRESGRFDVYSFQSNDGCYGIVFMAMPPFVLPPIPTDLPDTGYFMATYDSEGNFKSIRVWRHSKSLAQAVRMHQLWLEDEETRVEEANRLEPICEIPFSQAIALKGNDLVNRIKDCDKANEPARWMWICLLAHDQNGEAQYQFASYFYNTRNFPGAPPEFSSYIETYKWLSLAAHHGVRTRWNADFVATKMTPAEVDEAKKLTANWKPYPAECETVATQFTSP